MFKNIYKIFIFLQKKSQGQNQEKLYKKNIVRKYLKSMRLCKLIFKNKCPYFSHEYQKMIVID